MALIALGAQMLPNAGASPTDPTLSIFAGTGTPGGVTPGPATSSDLANPVGLTVDRFGNTYIADLNNLVIEKVTPSGTLSVFAGTGSSGPPVPGPATSSSLNNAQGVVTDTAGDVYIADASNHDVEKVTPGGTLSIFAGTGISGLPTAGPATSSMLEGPDGLAIDGSGDIYIADAGADVIEKVTPGGALSIVAGTGTGAGGAPTPGPATSSRLSSPGGVAVDSAGDFYIADSGNNVVEKVTPGGTLSIFAGTGSPGTPTPGPATSSAMNDENGVAFDSSDNLYVADTSNNVVEKVTPGGTLSIFAGTGAGAAPTPGPAIDSALHVPTGVAVDSSDNVYIADLMNNVVEMVTVPVVITAQAITFTSTPPTSATAGSTYTVAATGGGSGKPVVFSIDASTTPGACTLAGGVVTFATAGTCIIDANQSASTHYTAAPQVSQSIAITSTSAPPTSTTTSAAPTPSTPPAVTATTVPTSQPIAGVGTSAKVQPYQGGAVPVTISCTGVTCIGTANVSVARWSGSKRSGHWIHLVLARTNFSIPAGSTSKVRLPTTSIGRALLPKQVAYWSSRGGKFRMTLTVNTAGEPTAHHPVYIKSA